MLNQKGLLPIFQGQKLLQGIAQHLIRADILYHELPAVAGIHFGKRNFYPEVIEFVCAVQTIPVALNR